MQNFKSNELKSIVKKAIESMFKNDRQLLINNISERCICGRIMLYLSKEIEISDNFKQIYYVDIEYNRYCEDKKRLKFGTTAITCDIILHRRGGDSRDYPDNLIAIEVKKANAKKTNKEADKSRLKVLTSQKAEVGNQLFKYRLGVYCEINLKKLTAALELYQNETLKERIIYQNNFWRTIKGQE